MRDHINLIENAQRIEESFRIPLTYSQIVTPQYVDDLIEYGFESGHPHASALSEIKPENNYDPFSLERLLQDLQDDDFIPEDVELDDNDQVRPYLEKWLKLRVGYVRRRLLQLIKSSKNGIVVHRAIAVTPEIAHKITNNPVSLGEYWSFNAGQVFWGSGPELHFEAIVNPKSIDWLNTFRRNMNYVFGEEEDEAFLPYGTPLVVTRMWYQHDQIEFKHPNRVA